ncbi:hypothetical protein CLOM_g8482, partial [Closterium sp. NIES-68]
LAALQRCSLAEGLSSQVAAAESRLHQLDSDQQKANAGSQRGAGPPIGTIPHRTPPLQASEAAASVQQLSALLCPAALTAQTAHSLTLRLSLPPLHSHPSPAHAAVPTSATEGTASAQLAHGGAAAGGSASMEVQVLPRGGVASATIEGDGISLRSLPLHPAGHAAARPTQLHQQQQHGVSSVVPVAAAVAEASCLLRLLALRREHMARALENAPMPPRYLVEMAGQDAFIVRWANGATVTLRACNDWPMLGGHLAVADVALPQTAQSTEEKQQLCSLLDNAVGAVQQQGSEPRRWERRSRP